MRCIAAVVLLSCASPAWAEGGVDDRQVLAAELLIVRGDVLRLGQDDLPGSHRTGLNARIRGALGVLPWMLRQAGDDQGAGDLRVWQGRFPENGGGEGLVELLGTLTARHALDIQAFESQPDSPAIRREARMIHETYCAACHDERGQGVPDEALPARDLFLMAEAEDPAIFLARLVNGVKGTAEIGFQNPLSLQQIAALWRFYRSP